jgi:hypothetical protein
MPRIEQTLYFWPVLTKKHPQPGILGLQILWAKPLLGRRSLKR